MSLPSSAPPAYGSMTHERVLPVTMKAERVAETFGVSKSLVKRWVQQNTVRSTKIGAIRLIYTDSVLALLASGEGGTSHNSRTTK